MKQLILILFILLTTTLFSQSSLLMLMGDNAIPFDPETSTSMTFWAEYNVNQDVTKDANNKITSWGSGHPILQSDTSKSPTWAATGVIFDFEADYMRVTDAGLVQPITIYAVIKQTTWTSEHVLWCGTIANSNLLFIQENQVHGATPWVSIASGAYSDPSDKLVVGTYGLVKAVYNGASSVFQIDNNTAWTGNIGTNEAGGFVLNSYSNNVWGAGIGVKCILIYKGTPSAEDDTQIRTYLSEF